MPKKIRRENVTEEYQFNMFYPSGFKLPKDRNYEVENLGGGAYIVTNAYEGQYEYFEGRLIEILKKADDE